MLENADGSVLPFGRLGPMRKDLVEQVAAGESGNMMGLVHWVDDQVEAFLE